VSLRWQNIQQPVTFTIQLMEHMYVRLELSILSSCECVAKIRKEVWMESLGSCIEDGGEVKHLPSKIKLTT